MPKWTPPEQKFINSSALLDSNRDKLKAFYKKYDNFEANHMHYTTSIYNKGENRSLTVVSGVST